MLQLTPEKTYLVAIDSDGCAFDTMELKHKECFIPQTIKHYHLQPVSKFAREAAEFVNLYSPSRGINRFPALVETIAWLRRRPEVRGRGFTPRIPQGLVDWIARETKQANPALKVAAESTGDPDLSQALAWSLEVNQAVAQFVHGVPPFPLVRECLERLAGQADLVVASATPNEALEREWQEHGLAPLVRAICGQEVGTKKEILALAGQYPQGHTLMIGDAPGDYKAATANGALFFPINPGQEDQSWRRFFEEGIDRFLAGQFAGDYQAALLADFQARLPAAPPWPVDQGPGQAG